MGKLVFFFNNAFIREVVLLVKLLYVLELVMAGKLDKVDKAYAFFKRHADKSTSFCLKDLSLDTSWGVSTVRTYITKRWASFLKKNGNDYSVEKSFKKFNLDSFRQHHSQKETVQKYFYQLLLDKGVTACVSAIEIYNKPDFKFREESFSILMINAWELLLKAKLLSDNGDDVEAIYFKNKGKIVKTASGNPKTVSISKALNLLESSGILRNVVADNIRLLIEIRDESVHFVHNDMALAVKVQSIGMASLKNFMTIAVDWFGFDFKKYNFYLMPVSFFHLSDIESFSVDNDSKDNLVKHLNIIEKSHENDDDPQFSVSLKLETKLVKTTSDEAVQVRVTDDPNAPEIKFSEEDGLKNYPYTYQTLCDLLRKRYENFKQNYCFNERMREIKVHGDKFCKERRLEPSNPKSIYKMFYHNRILEEFDKHYIRK